MIEALLFIPPVFALAFIIRKRKAFNAQAKLVQWEISEMERIHQLYKESAAVGGFECVALDNQFRTIEKRFKKEQAKLEKLV